MDARQCSAVQCSACTLEVALSCQAGADFLVAADCKGWHLVQSAAIWGHTKAYIRDPSGVAT